MNKIYTHNINGLRSKITDFLAEVIASDNNFYMLCETHLNDTFHSSEIFPVNFNVFRCDRSEQTESLQNTKKKNGGGVLIAVDKSFESYCIGTGEKYGAEQVWVKVKCQSQTIILVELYIRPDSPFEVYNAHMNALNEVASLMETGDILILSGDFNLPQLTWFVDEVEDPNIAIAINAGRNKEQIVIDTCHNLGLYQINKIYNDNDRMLDLIWTNDPDFFTCCISESPLLRHEIHHPALEILIHHEIHRTSLNDSVTFFDFKNANYTTINESMIDIDWDEFFNGTTFNENVNKFNDFINATISNHVELKIKKQSSHPKWFDHSLISMKNKVNKLHRIKKSSKSDEDIRKYNAQRSEYKKCARSAFRNYKLEMEQLIDSDPLKFYAYVNSIRKSSADLPSEMEYNSQRFNSKIDIANSFAAHFSKAYSTPNHEAVQNYDHSDPLLKDLCANVTAIEINEEMVLQKVLELPDNLVHGPDEIPNFFIKRCIDTLLKPITLMLRTSLKSGDVADIWRKSFVRPIHKNGSRNKIDNYRGVALQCIIPKLLDSIIANHLNFHIKNVIGESQHGFVKGK